MDTIIPAQLRQHRVYQFHGFNVADGGANTTDKARPYLEQAGFEVIEVDYGEYDLIDVREQTDELVQRILPRIKPGDCFLAHSHGNTIVAKLIEAGAPFAAGVMIHPALRSYWTPPKDHPVRQIAVFSHWTDYATWGAFLLRTLSPGRLIWGRHHWGAMGSTGALGDDPRMINYTGAKGHSSGFSDSERWGPRWAKALVEAVGI
jgi:hypothetical protein